jgi:hypothetical protein
MPEQQERIASIFQPSLLYHILQLYTCKNGEQVSKKQAALWAQQALPQWSQLIQHALLWREDRRNEQIDHEATFAETKRFVDCVREQIAAE